MAILSNIFCPICNQNKQVAHSVRHYPTICHECQKKQDNDARAKHLAARAALPIEERLVLIEAQLYDNARKPHWDMHTPIG